MRRLLPLVVLAAAVAALAPSASAQCRDLAAAGPAAVGYCGGVVCGPPPAADSTCYWENPKPYVDLDRGL